MGTSKLNVDQAVRYLQSVTGSSSQHRCAHVIRLAIEAGGLKLTGTPIDAKNYGPVLTRFGFRMIARNGYHPSKGDVIVIQSYKGGNPSGHIEMYDGSRWLSDFKQMGHDHWPGSGYREAQPSYEIYRP